MRGRPALLACFLSGVILSFAFPEPSIAPLAWVAICPLLLVSKDEGPRRATGMALAFGLGFFGALLIWISAVGWVAWVALVILQAALFSLFGTGWGFISRLGRGWWLLFVPALWVTTELVRAYVPVVGFPWGQLAQGQVAFPRLLYAARLGGGEVVSFFVVAVNVLLALAVLERGFRRAALPLLAAFVLATPVLLSFMQPSDDAQATLSVGIVQGNARPGVHVQDERTRVDRHVALTESLAGENLDLVVWPESAVGIDPFLDQDVAGKVATAARSVDAPLIVGSNLEHGGGANYLVAALHVSPSGEIVERYQKTHLVPFGEHIPARPVFGKIPMLDQIPRDAVAGRDIHNFTIDGDVVSTVISFEGDFGPLVRDRIAAGGRLLVVATNTSTWGYSWASAQHMAMSQVRAVENGVPVVHAALSGISAFIDSSGNVMASTPLYEEATLVRHVSPATSISPYARSGEWFPWSCVVIFLAGAIVASRRKPVSTVDE